jgi:hypothetical protein
MRACQMEATGAPYNKMFGFCIVIKGKVVPVLN